MLSYLKILRPVNLLFLAFALIGTILLSLEFRTEPPEFQLSNFWISILFVYVICSVTASGYVINDYFDVETDAVNKPSKQIVGKSFSLQETRWFYFALLLDGLLFSTLLSWLTHKPWFGAAVVATQILLFLYAKHLKKSFLTGNVLVSILTIAPYWLIYYVFDVNPVLLPIFIFMSASGFLLTFIREIVKDWQDIAGDQRINAKTIAIEIGEKRTKSLVIRLLIVSIIVHLVFILEFLYRHESLWYIVSLFWPILAMLTVHVRAIEALRKENWNAAKLSGVMKFCMLLGVLWVYYLYFVWVYLTWWV